MDENRRNGRNLRRIERMISLSRAILRMLCVYGKKNVIQLNSIKFPFVCSV